MGEERRIERGFPYPEAEGTEFNEETKKEILKHLTDREKMEEPVLDSIKDYSILAASPSMRAQTEESIHERYQKAKEQLETPELENELESGLGLPTPEEADAKRQLDIYTNFLNTARRTGIKIEKNTKEDIEEEIESLEEKIMIYKTERKKWMEKLKKAAEKKEKSKLE